MIRKARLDEKRDAKALTEIVAVMLPTPDGRVKTRSVVIDAAYYLYRNIVENAE